MNAAREALSRAVNRAIAEGSLVYVNKTLNNETAFMMIEHAIGHLNASDTDAIAILTEAYKAIGPLGQIPSWESEGERTAAILYRFASSLGNIE